MDVRLKGIYFSNRSGISFLRAHLEAGWFLASKYDPAHQLPLSKMMFPSSSNTNLMQSDNRRKYLPL